ncbi:hypothetical protein ACJJTC_019810 [Scirpophaga incertulas]
MVFWQMVRMVVIFLIGVVVLAEAATFKDIKTELSLNGIQKDTEKRETRHISEKADIIFHVVRTLLKKSVDLHSVAACVINWFVSNSLFVIIGAVSALGFCKITNMCSLHYKTYLPVSDLQQYILPEHIDTAERFLRSAIEKYVES